MENPITQLEQLTLNSASKSFLRETAKWTYFLSILGFIGLALMVVFSFFAGALFNSLPETQAMPFDFGPVMTIIYLIMALIYFFPVYYLFQFSTKMKMALRSKNDEDLANAFEKLKSHYKFLGVFTIIILSIYFLFFLLAMIGVAFA
ncbi:hypothetical protein FDT66_04135 [Polaribacter aestuariivivens]|uniref:DUF5362 domain-containing protein n=1 Tax=Polaribacter aestuariivivens TaxID=2304626 RepID=A0A5S3N749_9FLAO|nr:DUF5362 family protein [Polaribacter aestuariivivens]TMM31165.1 hypothetical protein FDT66_04135 [Polaribacter aestuariivivens]